MMQGPNEKVVIDITYVVVKLQWLHLTTVTCLSSRRIIGWSLKPENTERLTTYAMGMEIDAKRYTASLNCSF